MSTAKTVEEESTEFTIHRIEQFLANAVSDSHQYFKSKEIANELGLSTKKVAALLDTVDEESRRVSIERWAYSTCTTWLVEPTD
jgi:orotate phosphoribosyltransferase-like protein